MLRYPNRTYFPTMGQQNENRLVQPAKQAVRDQYNYLFIWETPGVLAFAISRLAKGRTLGEFGKMWSRLTTPH